MSYFEDFKSGYQNQRAWTESLLEHKGLPMPSKVPMVPMRALLSSAGYSMGMEAYNLFHRENNAFAIMAVTSALMNLDEKVAAMHNPSLADASFRLSPLMTRRTLRARYAPQLQELFADAGCPDKIEAPQ